jgi:hypothetical protein
MMVDDGMAGFGGQKYQRIYITSPAKLPPYDKAGLEATAHYEEHAGRSTVHIGPYAMDGDRLERRTRHYTFPFGAWREVEETIGVSGATDRMEPVEMALAATVACLINSITGTVPIGHLQDVTSGLAPRTTSAVAGPSVSPPVAACIASSSRLRVLPILHRSATLQGRMVIRRECGRPGQGEARVLATAPLELDAQGCRCAGADTEPAEPG